MYPSLLHYTSLYCAINFRCHQLFCLFSRRGLSLVRRIWSKYRQEVCLAHVQTPRPGLNCVDNDLIKLCAFWLHYLRVSLLNCSTVGCVVRRHHTQPTHHRTYLSSFLTSLAQTFQTWFSKLFAWNLTRVSSRLRVVTRGVRVITSPRRCTVFWLHVYATMSVNIHGAFKVVGDWLWGRAINSAWWRVILHWGVRRGLCARHHVFYVK